MLLNATKTFDRPTHEMGPVNKSENWPKHPPQRWSDSAHSKLPLVKLVSFVPFRMMVGRSVRSWLHVPKRLAAMRIQSWYESEFRLFRSKPAVPGAVWFWTDQPPGKATPGVGSSVNESKS